MVEFKRIIAAIIGIVLLILAWLLNISWDYKPILIVAGVLIIAWASIDIDIYKDIPPENITMRPHGSNWQGPGTRPDHLAL